MTSDDKASSKDGKTGSVNVSTAVPGSTASASAGPDDTSCYKKFANGCCGDSPHAGKMKGKKLVCAKGTVPAASCKGFGTSCEPR